MRKTTIGAVAGTALACGLAVTLLASGTGSATAQKSADTGSLPSAAAAYKVTPKPAAKPAPKPAPKPAKKVTPKPKPAPKLPPIPVLVPAPAKATLSPDPSSTACRANPTTAFCSPDSVRYVVAGTVKANHDAWLPVLKKWGITNVQDTCVVKSDTSAQQCVVLATHGDKKITTFFKVFYDAKYAPDAVKAQTDAIHAKAMDDVQKATTTDQQAKILNAANAKIAAIEKAADAYNAAHPKASVNVVVD